MSFPLLSRLRRPHIANANWLRLGLIAGVLLLSALLAYLASDSQKIMVIALIGGLPVVGVFLRWPSLGPIAIILSGMLIHYTGPGGANAAMFLVAFLLGLWIVVMVVQQREIRLVSSETMAPALVLIVITVFSFAMGQLPWFPYARSAPLDAQLGGFAVYALSFGAFVLTANQIKDLRWLKWLTWIFIIVGSVNAVGLAIPPARSLIRTIFGATGSLFWVWITALSYGQVLFNPRLRVVWKAVLLGVLLSSLYILFGLKFKDLSGWLPVLITLWVITALRSWRMGMVLLLAALLGMLGLMSQIVSVNEYSLSTRLEAIPILLKILSANPTLGIGFANYYYYTPLFPLRGFYVSFNSHNNYIDILVQTGVVGLLGYFWLLAKIGQVAWRLRGRVPEGFSRAYVNAALGGFAGMLVVGLFGDWVLPFVYNIGLTGFTTSVAGWVLLGGIVVLERLFSHSERENLGKKYY